MRRLLSGVLCVLAVVCVVAGPSAQKVALSEDDIRTAIIQGAKGKGKRQGLVLRDSGQTWLTAMSSSDVSSGFWVELYTPTTWIMQQASNAAKKYQIMDPAAPVAEELLEPVLRVVAHPDTPNTVTARGMMGTASVEHVILRDEKKQIVIQPTWTEPFDEEVSNAMGGRAGFKGLNAKFPMDALKEIRGPKGNGEFFVTIVGHTREEKDFKVKQKHFSDLK